MKITCKEIVIDYLKINCDVLITHHLLDLNLPYFGRSKFGKIYSPSSYHRNFCWIKRDSELLAKNGIELVPEKIEGKNYLCWKVIHKGQIEMEL